MTLIAGWEHEPGRWRGGGRRDFRKKPGRSTLAFGVYASRFPSGLETSSCHECRQELARIDTLGLARAKGIYCGMYGNDWPDECWRRAKSRLG